MDPDVEIRCCGEVLRRLIMRAVALREPSLANLLEVAAAEAADIVARRERDAITQAAREEKPILRLVSQQD